MTPFTGDSSAAFLAYASKSLRFLRVQVAADAYTISSVAPNDIAVHLSESDTVLVTMPSFVTHPDVQLFVHPALAADAPPSYFGLASFKKCVSVLSTLSPRLTHLLAFAVVSLPDHGQCKSTLPDPGPPSPNNSPPSPPRSLRQHPPDSTTINPNSHHLAHQVSIVSKTPTLSQNFPTQPGTQEHSSNPNS